MKWSEIIEEEELLRSTYIESGDGASGVARNQLD